MPVWLYYPFLSGLHFLKGFLNMCGGFHVADCSNDLHWLELGVAEGFI